MKIEIEVTPTANPKIKNVGGKLCSGWGEVKAALRKQAEAQIVATLDVLFPGKAKAPVEPPAQ
ncbi:MAG: hypothetical protein V1755_05670 [Chloroflexota bacterium]